MGVEQETVRHPTGGLTVRFMLRLDLQNARLDRAKMSNSPSALSQTKTQPAAASICDF